MESSGACTFDRESEVYSSSFKFATSITTEVALKDYFTSSTRVSLESRNRNPFVPWMNSILLGSCQKIFALGALEPASEPARSGWQYMVVVLMNFTFVRKKLVK